ncbi:MAG: PRC-barrel domain-containing protein [Candidatus Woesearchaeota archaeon]|nr:MAG: PRC-barrel domain-containing protein [Candidatus Woesearchaeota archaeon]
MVMTMEGTMLRTKKIQQTYNMSVYTDLGEYFGDIEEAILTLNKVFGWRIKATKNSSLSKVIGGAKGVIVPHNLVKAVGDVMIINKAAIPTYEAKAEAE